MNTDNRLLTRESSEHIREFFSTVERLSVSMERLFAGRSPAMAGENFYTDRELAEKLKVSRRSLQQYRDSGLLAFTRLVSVSAMLPLFFKQEYLALSSKKDESRNSFSPYSRSLQGTFA